jgi:hypothetical protein
MRIGILLAAAMLSGCSNLTLEQRRAAVAALYGVQRSAAGYADSQGALAQAYAQRSTTPRPGLRDWRTTGRPLRLTPQMGGGYRDEDGTLYEARRNYSGGVSFEAR